MTQPTIIDLAGKIARELAAKGLHLFESVNYHVDGSPELANAYILFALSDDLAWEEFMRAGTIKAILQMPIALRQKVDAQQALLCAEKVQLLMFMLADEIHQITLGQGATTRIRMPPQPAPNRHRLTQDGATPIDLSEFDLNGPGIQ